MNGISTKLKQLKGESDNRDGERTGTAVNLDRTRWSIHAFWMVLEEVTVIRPTKLIMPQIYPMEIEEREAA
jgi:hypothetical protein